MDPRKLKRVTIIAKEFAVQRFCWLESLKYEDVPGTLPITICNNFFDIALLSWAHLFCNHKDELHFRNVLSNPDSFKSKIMDRLSMTDDEWDKYWRSLKSFRDERVAHIDPVGSVMVPDLDIAYECVSEYYNVVTTELRAQNQLIFLDSYRSLQDFVDKNADYYSTNITKVFNALKIQSGVTNSLLSKVSLKVVKFYHALKLYLK